MKKTKIIKLVLFEFLLNFIWGGLILLILNLLLHLSPEWLVIIPLLVAFSSISLVRHYVNGTDSLLLTTKIIRKFSNKIAIKEKFI